MYRSGRFIVASLVSADLFGLGRGGGREGGTMIFADLWHLVVVSRSVQIARFCDQKDTVVNSSDVFLLQLENQAVATSH